MEKRAIVTARLTHRDVRRRVERKDRPEIEPSQSRTTKRESLADDRGSDEIAYH